MDANPSEGRQLDERVTIIEERLAKVEEVLQEVVKKKNLKLEAGLERKLSLLIPKVEEILVNQQSPAADNPPVRPVHSSSSTTCDSSTSLHEAAETGDLAAVHFFLEGGESVNARDHKSYTALHLAASNGHTQVAEVLIGNGAAVNSVGNLKRTPLHCAAANGDVGIVARLVAVGASLDARDADGATAVALAAREGHHKVVSCLVEHGASFNIAANNGDTPLLMAVKNKGNGAIRFLLKKGASPTTKNHEGESSISIASARDEMELLEELLEYVPRSERGEMAQSLKVAASGEVVWMISDAMQGADVGSAGEEACVALARAGRHEALDALLRMGVTPNAADDDGKSALYWAMSQGHSLCVETLLGAGANVNG